jgi:recombinational DNA repair protein RecT
MSQQEIVPAEVVNTPTKRDIAAARMSYDGARAFASQVAIDRLGSLIETPEGRTKAAIAVNAIAEAVAMGLKGPQSQHWQELTCGALRNAVANILDTGLSPVGATKELYVFPEGGRLTVRVSPAGLRKLAARCGQNVVAMPVRKGEPYGVRVDNDGWRLTHEPDLFGDGEIVGVYVAVYRATDGALMQVTSMSLADIKVNRSKSKMKNGGPWADFFEQMAIKSVLHKALSSGAITFDEGLTHALAAVPIGGYDGDADEADFEAPTVRQVTAPDAPRAFQRPAPPTEETADPASGEQS